MIRRLPGQPSIDRNLAFAGEGSACVAFTWQHDQSYLENSGSLELQVILSTENNQVRCLVAPQAFSFDESTTFEDIASSSNLTPVYLDQPLPLETVSIPKPWGQEIWYTGIESRGISTVNGVPLPWLLDIFGERLGCHSAPLLLKILDPFPDENLGDLYFEMHEEKVEVYVVTHIDPEAWPEGIGAIRYGFNKAMRDEFNSDDDFLQAYLHSVNEYRTVRHQIDGLLIKEKERRGIAASDTINTADYLQDLRDIPFDLATSEVERREAMYAFTNLKPLKVGDVVTVQPGFPHSLQHGVRVVEFQTPHYERFILSFGQQVLTQDHWDTEAALKKVQFSNETIKGEAADPETIADFSAFTVRRILLEPGTTKVNDPDRYQLLMGISGEFILRSADRQQSVAPEQAVMISANAGPYEIESSPDQQVCLLVAEEKEG